MSSLLVGLLGALVATNAPVSVSNLVSVTTGISVRVPDPNDPLERELNKLMEEDDAAQAEVDEWIRDNQQFAAKGAGISDVEMRRRILKRFGQVRQDYEDFIKRHPDHARVRIAYASFLHDIAEDGEVEQLEKASELDPKAAAVWNNLANYYGEVGPVTKAFGYYEKALELDPFEPVYLQNFATVVCIFRKDAREYYHLTEQEVFDKSLELYQKALKFDPRNFPLATDLAQTYYLIQPPRTEEALRAWTNAMSIAHDEIEREGVHLHLARFKLNTGRFAEARAHLNAVTNQMYSELRTRLARNLEEKEKTAVGTNHPPAEVNGKK